MKKSLLDWAVRLYMFILCITLLYTGSLLERGNKIDLSQRLGDFIPAAVYWLFFLIGKRIAKHPQYLTSYCVAAVATLAVSGFFWGISIYAYRNDPFARRVDYFGWPGSVFFCALLIAIFYIICAVITRREQKEAATLPKTE